MRDLTKTLARIPRAGTDGATLDEIAEAVDAPVDETFTAVQDAIARGTMRRAGLMRYVTVAPTSTKGRTGR